MSQQTQARPDRRPEFITLIAVYQFVTAGILLLLSCMIPAVLFPSMFVFVDAAGGIITGLFMAIVVLTLLLGFAFASIVVGWGLLRSREWARLGAIVLAAFALIGFPVWTIVAILILIYLTSEDGRAAFRHDPAAPDMASQAVYKAEPPTPPSEETRRMGYTGQATAPTGGTNGPPDDVVSGDETGSVPIPAADPAWVTQSFYDQEADVTDHFRRWKASLEQESQTGPAEAGTVEMPAEPAEEPTVPEERISPDAPQSGDEGEPDTRPPDSEARQDTAPSEDQSGTDDGESPERPPDV